MATTSVTVGELLTGARRLPAGTDRSDLLAAIERTLGAFPASVLAYDDIAARRYAEMQEVRRCARYPVERRGRHDCGDLFVSVTLATRNTRDFEGSDCACSIRGLSEPEVWG